MPTNLTQIEDVERDRTILRVEGSLTFEDAVLLEKIALQMRSRLSRNLTLDLADVHFLDSESAPILRRLEREHGCSIEGIEIFLQAMVNETERK